MRDGTLATYGIALALIGVMVVAWSAGPRTAAGQVDPRVEAAAEDVGIDPIVGTDVPLDTQFYNEQGEVVRLSSVADGSKPVILVMVYYYCPQLCNQVLNGISDMLTRLERYENPLVIGEDFDVVTISFDETETPALALQKKTNQFNYHSRGDNPGTWTERPENWHWWSSNYKPADARRLSASIGFYYEWQPRANPPQYAHGAGLFFVAPSGQLATAIGGVNYKESDVQSLLTIASEGQIESNFAKDLFFLCYHFDPKSGTWVAQADRIMMIGALLTVFVVGSVLAFFWINERRRARAGTDTTPPADTSAGAEGSVSVVARSSFSPSRS